MTWSATPKIVSEVFKNLVWNIPNNENQIFLTFDDGPIPETTPYILSVLNEYSIKATFFCLGKNALYHYQLIEKILSNGHSIGSHGYAHLNGWKTNNREYYLDIEKAHEILNVKIFRPPYGRIKPSQVKYLKKFYEIIMWDVLSLDYKTILKPEDCVQNVLSSTNNGSIIVFHDSIKAEKNLKKSLHKSIETLLERGFVFSTINYEELIINDK
ncbi:MAG: polysaccharide deacetylase family protein [Bacteroidota bacterium]